MGNVKEEEKVSYVAKDDLEFFGFFFFVVVFQFCFLCGMFFEAWSYYVTLTVLELFMQTN